MKIQRVVPNSSSSVDLKNRRQRVFYLYLVVNIVGLFLLYTCGRVYCERTKIKTNYLPVASAIFIIRTRNDRAARTAEVRNEQAAGTRGAGRANSGETQIFVVGKITGFKTKQLSRGTRQSSRGQSSRNRCDTAGSSENEIRTTDIGIVNNSVFYVCYSLAYRGRTERGLKTDDRRVEINAHARVPQREERETY